MIIIRANGPGIGDAMFLSSVAIHYYIQNNEQVIINSNFPELFEKNFAVKGVISWNEHPVEAITFPELHNQQDIKEHNVIFMCKKLGIFPPKKEDIQQFLFCYEFDGTIEGFSYATVHVETGSWTKNKMWGINKYQELVDKIIGDIGYDVLQIGGENEVLLKNVVDRRGLPLKEVSTILANAHFHVCGVTGTMHMASGTNTKCFVIVGGREDPNIIGYQKNTHFIHYPDFCGNKPCWKVEDCPFGHYEQNELIKPCMETIKVIDVLNKIKEFMN